MMSAISRKQVSRKLDYQDTLKNYLNNGGEDSLKDAYELGRESLADGMGLLDMASAHQQALISLLESKASVHADVVKRVKTASLFLSEVLSPFEISRLSSGDSRRMLHVLLAALEKESSRIGQRLHDDCSQMLAVVYLELAEISRGASESTTTQVRSVVTHLDDICEQLRNLSHELRPLVLEQVGLIPALQALADGILKRTGCRMVIHGEKSMRYGAAIEATLYRVIQEALLNISRHARASMVDIRLWVDEARVFCNIKDDGAGFDLLEDAAETSSGLGLLGVRERVHAISGIYKIITAPGKGVELEITVPL